MEKNTGFGCNGRELPDRGLRGGKFVRIFSKSNLSSGNTGRKSIAKYRIFLLHNGQIPLSEMLPRNLKKKK